jgi:beta-lactamase regulating signal transducer with metallopeptidase domain
MSAHLPVTWIAERFVNGLPEGVAIALVASILLRMAGRRSSSTRFAVWFAALVAIVALPLLTGWRTAGNAAGASVVSVSASWAIALFFAWAAMASVALGRVAFGLWNVRKLRTDCEEIDTGFAEQALSAAGKSRKVTVAVSPQVSVPAAIGFFKPMILLPEWALSELSPEELYSIVLHELAHLRRWDDWTNLAQRIIRALLFFHPAVWWIDHKLSLEREMACDDTVLENTANPRAYAECLVTVAEKSLVRRGMALAQAAVSRVRDTSRRIAQILDGNRAPATRVWKPAVGFVAILSVAGAVSLAHAPELVAFRDAAPMIEAASNSHAVLPARFVERAASPKVIPAKFEEPGSTAQLKSLMAKRHAPHRPAVLQAKSDVPTMQPQSVAMEMRSLPVRTVYVVMRTEVYGASSMMISVWQISIVDPQLQSARIPAKKI